MENPAEKSTSTVDLSLVVPCLNEGPTVCGTIRAIEKSCTQSNLSFEVIVIDDGSTDDTADRVRHFQKENPSVPVRLVVNEFNKGLARSYLDGVFMAKGRYCRICCGDDVEPVESLMKIFSYIDRADIIAPYHPEVPGRTFLRGLLSFVYTRIINVFSGHGLRYYNGCPMILREQVMRWHSYSDGFGFQADMLTRMMDEGATFIEFPVFVHDRVQGASQALTFRNLSSTGHVILEVILRRIRKELFWKKREQPSLTQE